MQRKQYYVATGKFPFPDDMLRYDDATIIGTGTLLGQPAYLISGFCTADRWRSFVWSTFPANRYLPNGDSERGPVLWKVQVQGSWEFFPVAHYMRDKP